MVRLNPYKSTKIWNIIVWELRPCPLLCARIYLTDIRRFREDDMARTLKEASLTTRNARAKLPAGIHWRGIDPETHLGYRKGVRGGVWLVRWRNGAGYRQDRLGTADDEISEGTLDYSAALRSARDRVEVARREELAASTGEIHTVRTAVLAYNEVREARYRARYGDRTGRPSSSSVLERYVIGRGVIRGVKTCPPSAIADVPLRELTEAQLVDWRDSLPATLKPTSIWYFSATLQAAINLAYRKHRSTLPSTLPAVVKAALVVSRTGDGNRIARENQILDVEAIGKIIAAARNVDDTGDWGGDLYRMIVVLAATGARFSQVTRLTVSA